MIVNIFDAKTGEMHQINSEPSERIEELKGKIYKNKGFITSRLPSQQKLVFEGRELGDHLRLSTYGITQHATIELSSTSNVSLGTNSNMRIYVTTLNGKIFEVTCKPSSTIQYIKEQVQEKEGIPPSQQALVFDSRNLEDDRTVLSYNIQADSILRLVLRLRGGGGLPSLPNTNFMFSDVSQPFDVRKPSVNGAPSYRAYSRGVNSEAICKNPKCQVYGKRFICNHGYGLYRLNEDPSICPACQSKSPKTETFAFSRAKVVIRSSALNDSSVQVRDNLSESDGNYKVLPDGKVDNIVEYEFVEIFSCPNGGSILLESYETCKKCCRTLYQSQTCVHAQKK